MYYSAAGAGRGRQPRRRLSYHGVLKGCPSDLRGTRMGVPGPRQILAGSADRRDALVDRHHVPRPPVTAGDRQSREPALRVLLQRIYQSRSSTPSGWRAPLGPRSRSATSGGSGSSTCGSRTSWNCSPRSSSRTSSCCSEWCRRNRPASDLLRRHPVLGRRGGRHDAPLLLQRRAGRAHGPRGIFLRGGGHPAHLPDGRGVDVPAHGSEATGCRRSGQFPHRWAVMFLVSVGFWNFLGAGVFGFMINLPMVSYYQIGTHLTANHAHAAFVGVYLMLAMASLVFALRHLLRPEDWSDRLVGFSFWGLNLGWPGWCSSTCSHWVLIGTRCRTDTGTPGRSSSSGTTPDRVAAPARGRDVHRRGRPARLHDRRSVLRPRPQVAPPARTAARWGARFSSR